MDMTKPPLFLPANYTNSRLEAISGTFANNILWLVKDNQASLHEDVQRFFQAVEHAPGWHVPPLPQAVAEETTKQSGRIETRRLTTIPDEHGYLQWPGLKTVFKLERRVVRPLKKEESFEVVFGITSLAFTSQLAQNLLSWTRQHWSIENKLHYRRDVTLREDATRMKQSHQAQVVATLNNFVIALTTYLGFSNLASARRTFQAKIDALVFSTA